MTVNDQATYRKGEYFRAELSVDNSAAALWQGVINVAVLSQGTNGDIMTGTAQSLSLSLGKADDLR